MVSIFPKQGISHIIIDEVHERDINTDLLLIILRDIINVGLDLKVIIMSATIDVSHFEKFFNHCPVFQLKSKMFPVTPYYLEDVIEMLQFNANKVSFVDDDFEGIDHGGVDARVAAENDDIDLSKDPMMSLDFDRAKYSNETRETLKKLPEGGICFELITALLTHIDDNYVNGAVLIFLPGWNAIFSLYHHLRMKTKFGDDRKFVLLPLHSQLSQAENSRVSPQKSFLIKF